jgi:hypothetical protein
LFGRPACFATSVYRQPPHTFHPTRPDKATGKRTTGSQSMRAGAPTYFSPAVRDVLSNTDHDRWIGRGGPTAWPPRSPDLNLLDFYLCGHLKFLVYTPPVGRKEALHHCIVDVCQTINICPGISERTRRSMMRRVEACVESYGGHFEHLLYRQLDYFSGNSQIKCFRTHVDVGIFPCFGIWNC